MIKKYKKKPVIIEAIQWTGANKSDIQAFMGQHLIENTVNHQLRIPTLEGEHIASVGDFIIKGIHGEFYPCKPDIFEKTYDSVDG